MDREFELASGAARLAFDQGRFEQAALLYRQVLEMAYTRDDLPAIIDAQYNAAVCYVRSDNYDTALELVEQAKTELARGRRAVPVDVKLLEATVLYRQGQRDAAWAVTDGIVAAAGEASAQANKRAHFLRGLMAAERNDTLGLRDAIAALGVPTDARLQADYEELSGRLALSERRYDAAVLAFTEAARLRTETVDYRGTVRALGLAGEASEKSGRLSEAASHFLRAGRSAALQEATEEATQLLQHAERLATKAGEPSIAEEAKTLLARLRNPKETASRGVPEG